MGNPFESFKKMPTFEQLVTSVRELAQHMGLAVRNLENNVQENNAITDAAIEECNLKLAFLMQQITITKPLHGGLIIDGKPKLETKTALQVYLETGRQKMMEQREEFLRAQGVSTAEEHASELERLASIIEEHNQQDEAELLSDTADKETTH